MKYVALGLTLAAFWSALLGQAQDTVKGHLIDVLCGTEPGTDSAAAAKHDKMCLEMEDCAASGFGVMTADSKFYRFDEQGSEQARTLIAETAKSDDWRVLVAGTISGETIAVQSITLDQSNPQ